MKQLHELTKRDIMGAQSDLLEELDEDFEVNIRKDLLIHISSKRAPALDYVLMLSKYTEGVPDLTEYFVGTTKAPPTMNTMHVTGVDLNALVLQWRHLQEQAMAKEADAKRGSSKPHDHLVK